MTVPVRAALTAGLDRPAGLQRPFHPDQRRQAKGYCTSATGRSWQITSPLGDEPMSNMIRQIMALFDEYQSRKNAKHTLRARKQSARQGFWNGSLPPIGYRTRQ